MTAAVQTIEITDVLDPRLDPLSVVLDPVQIGNDARDLLPFETSGRIGVSWVNRRLSP